MLVFLIEIFSKPRMRQPERSSSLYQLSISRAPQLRCVNSPVKSCGICENCCLGVKLNQTKEWFCRSGEPVKRKYLLGLVQHFDSLDLAEYVTSLLQSFQYKDFTYMRSRSKPSLIVDTVSPPTNHALNETELLDTVENYLEWFSVSTYWTKANYMLGLMQLCDTHLLHIVATRTRALCERERRKQRAVEDGLIDRDDDEYMSLWSHMAGNTVQNTAETGSNKSLLIRSAASHTETSGIQDTDTASDILSLCSDDIELSQQKTCEGLSTSKSQSQRGTDSADISSQVSAGFVGSPISPCQTRSIPPSRQSLRKSPTEMTDFEREYFSEDYMSGEDADENVAQSGVDDDSHMLDGLGSEKYKDFVRCLPVHLSKRILGMLDKNSLTNCLCLSKHWRVLAEEVKQDYLVHQLMTEEIMLMQGASAKGMNPRYAKFVPVCVPLGLGEDTKKAQNRDRKYQKDLQGDHLKECYEGIATKEVEMEERNIYCGAYNVLVLQDMEDPNRCANFSGGRLVVSGSFDRRVRLMDASTGKCERIIQGHAGSVRCVYVSEKRGIVLSGGYDTSIRCWDIGRGNCKCIFRGHRGTVLCISLHGNTLASGSRDKSVKVWNFTTGKCRRTFRHRHVVQTVHVSDALVVSGCEGGKVKVWDIEQASLLKSLDGHHGAITSVKSDDYHIVTGSLDCYAMAWSAIGKHKKCLQAFRHPKEVLCLEFLYCRVVTGSADGKLRVWNLLNGDCLRIIRGNSKNDAINTIRASGDRMIVNTLSNLLIFNFESVQWDYTLQPERPEALRNLDIYGKTPPRRLARSHVRAHKLMRADTRDSLPSRPPSCSKTPTFDLNITCLAPPGSSQKRIASAPPRIKHNESTLSSVNAHVQRILQAHEVQKQKFRPRSSPAATFRRSRELTGNDVIPTEVDGDLRTSMIITKLTRSHPKSPSLIENRRSQVITRSRSAPAYRTQVLPPGKRGWTTSVAEPLKAPENKIMVTAEQAREKIAKMRPQSAQVFSNKESISFDPVKSLSSLHLKTYSSQLDIEEQLIQGSLGNRTEQQVTHRNASSHRPKSCIPCVR